MSSPEYSPASSPPSMAPPETNASPVIAPVHPLPLNSPPPLPPPLSPPVSSSPKLSPPEILSPTLPSPESSSSKLSPPESSSSKLSPPEISSPTLSPPESSSPPMPQPEISSLPPLPPPENSSQPIHSPESSSLPPPRLPENSSPPLPLPENSSPSPLPLPENAAPPIQEPTAPPPLTPLPRKKFPPPPLDSVPVNSPPKNNFPPPPLKLGDGPIQSPDVSLPHVATPLNPNVTMKTPPKSQTRPPASSSASPPSYSIVGDLSHRGYNGNAPMSVGNERGSVGRSSISKGVIFRGVSGGFLILIVIGWLVCVYLKSRKRSTKGDKGYNEAGSKDPPNLQQNIPPPASHVVTVLASSLPSPPRGSKVGDSNLANYIQPPRLLGVKFGISSGWFTYDELVKATANFSEANLVGQGGFGHVYKGVLSNGKEVAVKKLNIANGQGEREFQAEVETISRVHHKHLVSLIGYCITDSDSLLVYEFVPNNTLEFHLRGKERPVIEWSTRMKIAIGSAKGLAYLHEDCHPAIIHRDVKASNILLDLKFEAKVSDFGLAKSFPDNGTYITHISTRVMGTFGYLAPEYAASGQVTERSDVYSFGIVLLELLTGRPPITTTVSSLNESLVDWAWPLLIRSLKDGIYDTFVDPKLHGCYSSNEMSRMVACATACVQHSPRLRPRMSQIIRALEGNIFLTDIVEGIQSRYDVHQYNLERKMFERILASQEHAFTGNSQSTSEYGLHPSDSNSESQNHQR